MQRTLFAKQLIQQTHLSMTDIAITAGYQSLRQLQRSMSNIALRLLPSLEKRAGSTKGYLFISFLSAAVQLALCTRFLGNSRY